MDKKHITRSVYRVLLSEVLPYELPFFFSFRGFYNFADRARLWIDKDGTVKAKSTIPKGEKLQETVISMLNECKTQHDSFIYGINKDGNENGRTLFLPHPYVGLQLVDFYKRYAGLLVNCCSRSNYSLRYPHHIAKNIREINRRLVLQPNDNGNAATTPRNYFYYSPFRNINYFYESGLFQRLEGRYKYLFQTDMKHCFESIPAERLAEAVYKDEKETLKANTFASAAYDIMKDISGKYKGVAIGPEFSRIFAEIILQRIDCEIEKRMSSEGYYHEKDYVCFRYVDDTFFFYNEEKVKKLFITIQEMVLNSWSISVNHDKEQNYTLPYVSPISIAKEQISLMLDDMLKWRLETAKGIVRVNKRVYDTPLAMNSQKYIQVLKTIISSDIISIDKLTSFLLSQLQKRLRISLKKLNDLLWGYKSGEDAGLLDKTGKRLYARIKTDSIRFLCEVVKFVFFVFKIDMRMSTSIKAVSIIDMIIHYVCGRIYKDSKDIIWSALTKELYKTVQDEITFILKNNKLKPLSGLEICNMLSIINDLPSDFSISNDVIMTFIDHKFDNDNDDVNFLMAFAILKSLKEPNLLYCNEHEDEDIQNIIVDWLINRLSNKGYDLRDAECFYIIAGLMPLKTLDSNTKERITQGVDNINVKGLCSSRTLFMQWKGSTLQKAIDEKFAVDVY